MTITPFFWFDGQPDPEKSQRVMKALLSMKKLIIADLERAAG